jgi:hypothetical protein
MAWVQEAEFIPALPEQESTHEFFGRIKRKRRQSAASFVIVLVRSKRF